MADYLVTDAELTDVADAIRTKGETSSPLVWPDGYVDAIDAISTGGSVATASFDFINGMAEGGWYTDANFVLQTLEQEVDMDTGIVHMRGTAPIGTIVFVNGPAGLMPATLTLLGSFYRGTYNVYEVTG